MKKLLSVFMLIPILGYANGIEDLNKFLSLGHGDISASFVQTIYGVKKNRVSLGTMEISRPNKFKWDYIKEQQLIVSGGRNIYIYDQPLAQVTKKSLAGAISKTPAAILAGGNDVKKYYNISTLGESGGINWVMLKPKSLNEQSGFNEIEVGFIGGNISRMKFIDNSGNHSLIVFNDVKTNIVLPKKDFIFTIPQNVDVISE